MAVFGPGDFCEAKDATYRDSRSLFDRCQVATDVPLDGTTAIALGVKALAIYRILLASDSFVRGSDELTSLPSIFDA
jgi:hypothetical protein